MIERTRFFAKSIARGVRSDQPLEVGRALTKLFLVIVAVLALLPQHTAEGGWSPRILALLISPANEIGDTFAGVAGVLAFLWIIITVWLQSQELSAQREELRLTRLEMKEQREATQDMARSMSAQARLFEGEARQRDEDRAKEHLDELIANLRIAIVECGLRWTFNADQSRTFHFQLYPFSVGGHLKADDVNFFSSYLSALETKFPEIMQNTKIKTRTPDKQKLEKVSKMLGEALSLRDSLSVAQLARLKRLKIEELSEEVELYLGANIWI